MVRTYKRVSGRKKWGKANIRAAIEAVTSGGCSVKRASVEHSVPRQTLARHLQQEEEVEKLGRFATVFTEPQEQELIQHILNLEKRFYGMTTVEIRRLAFDLAEKNLIPHPFNKSTKLAGPDWLAGFRKRHPEISLRTPEATSIARAQGFNQVAVDRFFQILDETLATGNFSASRIYNIDETAILTVGFAKMFHNFKSLKL